MAKDDNLADNESLQDPLPEGKFFYRRIFSYVLSGLFILLLAYVILRIDNNDDLRRVALYLCVLLFVVITYYMVAPSAEHVVKMVQAARIFRDAPSEEWRQPRNPYGPGYRRRGRRFFGFGDRQYRSGDAAPTSKD